MVFTKGTFLIETKNSNEMNSKIAKNICDWADKHEMYVCFGTNANGEYMCDYEKKGRTRSFCKGHADELKDLIKVGFNAKVKNVFQMY